MPRRLAFDARFADVLGGRGGEPTSQTEQLVRTRERSNTRAAAVARVSARSRKTKSTTPTRNKTRTSRRKKKKKEKVATAHAHNTHERPHEHHIEGVIGFKGHLEKAKKAEEEMAHLDDEDWQYEAARKYLGRDDMDVEHNFITHGMYQEKKFSAHMMVRSASKNKDVHRDVENEFKGARYQLAQEHAGLDWRDQVKVHDKFDDIMAGRHQAFTGFKVHDGMPERPGHTTTHTLEGSTLLRETASERYIDHLVHKELARGHEKSKRASVDDPLRPDTAAATFDENAAEVAREIKEREMERIKSSSHTKYTTSMRHQVGDAICSGHENRALILMKRMKADHEDGLLLHDHFHSGLHSDKRHTLLMLACRAGMMRLVKFILTDMAEEHGHARMHALLHDVDTETQHTAMHLAAANGHIELLKFLHNNHGARKDVRNHAGQTPHDLYFAHKKAFLKKNFGSSRWGDEVDGDAPGEPSSRTRAKARARAARKRSKRESADVPVSVKVGLAHPVHAARAHVEADIRAAKEEEARLEREAAEAEREARLEEKRARWANLGTEDEGVAAMRRSMRNIEMIKRQGSVMTGLLQQSDEKRKKKEGTQREKTKAGRRGSFPAGTQPHYMHETEDSIRRQHNTHLHAEAHIYERDYNRRPHDEDGEGGRTRAPSGALWTWAIHEEDNKEENLATATAAFRENDERLKDPAAAVGGGDQNTRRRREQERKKKRADDKKRAMEVSYKTRFAMRNEMMVPTYM